MKIYQGVVTSTKNTKTVRVEIANFETHPLYKKRVKRTKQFLCHDEMNAKLGDVVTIQECRPMSAQKYFKVTAILDHGIQVEDETKNLKQEEV